MRFLSKYWKIILAVLLAASSVPMFITARANSEEYEQKVSGLRSEIDTLQSLISVNSEYADIQDKLEPALAKLDESRRNLYAHFPSKLLEEDQIVYMLYLENILGGDVTFAFADAVPIAQLSDGSAIGGITVTVNYQSTYQGFKDLIEALATDERIASVRTCSITYDAASDTTVGNIILTLYTVSAPGELPNSLVNDYTPPEGTEYETGRDTIFE